MFVEWPRPVNNQLEAATDNTQHRVYVRADKRRTHKYASLINTNPRKT